MMKNIKINADLMLIMVAIIWGSGFIATEYAIKANMGPMLIMALRFTIAAIVMLFVMRKSINKIKGQEWVKGSIAGVLLFLAFYLQTLGQSMTTVSNSAFITATNVIMVPFVVWAIVGTKPKIKIILLACLTFIGVAVLTVSPDGLALNVGDLFILLCAIGFAFHIAYLGVAVDGNSAVTITFIQISVAAVLSVLGFIVFSRESLEVVDFAIGLPATLYLGLFSTSACFFMQTSAQKRTSASKAGIIMSTEGFFGTLFSIVLGFELLTIKVIIGGTLILVAVILTEVKWGSKKVKGEKVFGKGIISQKKW